MKRRTDELSPYYGDNSSVLLFMKLDIIRVQAYNSMFKYSLHMVIDGWIIHIVVFLSSPLVQKRG
jgi:hypothetical protein